MFERTFSLGLLTALFLTLGAGCKGDPAPNSSQSTTNEQSEISGPDSSDSGNQKSKIENQESFARLHWLGEKRLASETNAAYFMSILDLPESRRLAAQTLDKLALAPWLSTLPNHEFPALTPQEVTNRGYQTLVAINPSASLLRPLLQDLLEQESYLEARQPTNQALQAVLAIRLTDQRANLWQTNLAAVLSSLTHNRAVPGPAGAYGWQLTMPKSGSTLDHRPSTVLLDRSGEWTLLALGSEQNDLLTDLRSRLARDHSPFAVPPTNYWLDAKVDLFKLASVWPLLRVSPRLPLPRLTLQVVGDGKDVRSHADLKFSARLPLELDAWNVPTNLVQDPLVSFTAIRGLRPLLNSCKSWLSLQAGEVPNQAYFWGLDGMPLQDYCALPFSGASNVVYRLAQGLLQTVNPWIQASRFGQLVRTNFNGLAWTGAPFISPEMRCSGDGQGKFAFAGLIPPSDTERSIPAELLKGVTSRTNLLYYDWEITQPRLAQWVYLGQLVRLLAHRAQLPPSSASFQWLEATGPKLGNCVTLLSTADLDRLTLARRSSFGLNSVELQLLADWLESPQFPAGLHSFLPGLTPQ